MIKLENVSKGYSEGKAFHKILSDVNLEIRRGEIIILYGKSGSGKSTLLNLLAGIDLPDNGNIYFEGRSITALSEKERTLYRRKKIGFIFQFFNLIPTLTVSENLKLPLELNSSTFERVHELLDELGLSDRINAYPDVLSGGEQQRVAIARALIHNPDFILADEPTGNLDFDTSKQIIELIDRIVKQQGKTMIMATHSRDVMGLADRILTLKDGKFTELQQK
jgi:putative ABC transport system ATP-binding protein